MPRERIPWPNWVTSKEPVKTVTVSSRIAFRDCDPMGVLWHGNYLAYCELARNELGRQLGYGIETLSDLGQFAPIVRTQVVHLKALRFEVPVTITAKLYPAEVPRLYHRYQIHTDEGLAAEAETDQGITDRNFNLLLQIPPELQQVFSG